MVKRILDFGICVRSERRSMNKLELINSLHKEAGISKPEAAKVVQIFFSEMSSTLAAGKRIEIRGLFSFYLKNYKPYTGRNPKTGEREVQKALRKVIYVKYQVKDQDLFDKAFGYIRQYY